MSLHLLKASLNLAFFRVLFVATVLRVEYLPESLWHNFLRGMNFEIHDQVIEAFFFRLE